MKYRYYYEGIPLSIYCRKNDINVNTITARINKKQKQCPKLTDQQVVDLVMSTRGQNTKYYYGDITLSQYCKDNDLNYYTIQSRIESLIPKYPNESLDRIVKMAVDEYTFRGVKYFYEGIPLIDYCELNPTINYKSITKHISRQKKKFPEKNDDEIIKEYMKKEHTPSNRYFIEGIPLMQYCIENDINYSTVLSNLCKARKQEEYKALTDDERLNIIIEKYRPRLIYTYKGMTLKEYCKENNYSYNTVYNYIRERMLEDIELTMDDAITEAIHSINRYGIIYYYNGISLVDYCEKNDLNASYVRGTILRKQEKYKGQKTLEEIIDESIKEYEYRKYIKKRNEIFSYLENISNDDIEKINEICTFLKIDQAYIKLLTEKSYSTIQAIKIIWYFGNLDINDKKGITTGRIEQLGKLVESIKSTAGKTKEEFDLFELVSLYKCNLYDTREIILNHEENYFYKNIQLIKLDKNAILTKKIIEELLSEQKTCLMEIIEIFNSNIPGQFIKYMDLTIKWKVKTFYIKYQRLRNASFSETIYSNNSRKTKTREETFENKTENNEEQFSEDLLKVLKNIPSDYFEFIILRYQECYSLEELSQYYNRPIEEIEGLEEEILNYIRGKEQLKSYILKK